MEFDIHKIDCEDNILAQGLMGKAKAMVGLSPGSRRLASGAEQ